MRLVLLVVGALFLVAALGGVARAQSSRDYWFAGNSNGQHGVTLEYIDLASVAEGNEPTHKRYWATTVYERPWPIATGGEVRSLISLMEVNCRTSQTRNLQITAYDRNQRSVQTSSEAAEWRYAVPDTVSWFSLRLVCDGTAASDSPFLHVGHMTNVLSSAESTLRRMEEQRRR